MSNNMIRWMSNNVIKKTSNNMTRWTSNNVIKKMSNSMIKRTNNNVIKQTRSTNPMIMPILLSKITRFSAVAEDDHQDHATRSSLQQLSAEVTVNIWLEIRMPILKILRILRPL